MEKPVRVILLGGFLGAGKTTALCRIAQYYIDKGLRVGLITNDQANNLVDTHLVKAEGFNTEEIAGGCFCCRFNDLIEAAARLREKINPDIILAEPVGSCTDINATVIQPFNAYYKEEYLIQPYATLLDPVRASEIALSDAPSSFSVNVNYIFRKQLEESDIIALNKIDTLGAKEAQDMVIALKKRFPKSDILSVSARTGQGFDAWIRELESGKTAGRNIADVNYDIYASGEAELAWLNFIAILSSDSGFDADRFLRQILADVKKELGGIKGEVAHLKLALSTENGNSLINLVHNDQEPVFFKNDAGTAKKGRLIVNARVRTEPETLHNLVSRVVSETGAESGIAVVIEAPQYFRPSRPVPVHRINREQK